MNKIFSSQLITALISSLLVLSACGGGDLSPIPTPTAPPVTKSEGMDEFADAIPKILQGIEDIKQEIKALSIKPFVTTGTTPKPGTSVKPGTKPGTTTSPKPTTGATPKPTSSTPAPASNKGQDELKAIMNKIKTAPFVSLVATKTEKNLDSGKVSTNKIKMFSKQPNVVRIDILESTSGSAGVSALYTSGVGSTIKIKKLFIKLDLAKTDEKVVSNNGYTADFIDLFGVSTRMSSYKAELIGTTQLNGSTINILKVSTTGSNTLDERIGYEYLGYDPETYSIRLWEIYDKQGGKDPYYRMTLSDMTYPDSLPDSTFNL